MRKSFAENVSAENAIRHEWKSELIQLTINCYMANPCLEVVTRGLFSSVILFPIYPRLPICVRPCGSRDRSSSSVSTGPCM